MATGGDMTKYHPYPRRALRALFGRWLWRHRLRLSIATVGVLALMAFEAWMLGRSGANSGLSSYLMGAMHVAIVASYVGAVVITFLAHEREAIFHLRGAWGEDFTKDELKRARRKKLIWGWVDSVTVQNGDIDHLVVTRSGGLVAIDSKWRSGVEHLDPATLARQATKARVRAEGVLQSVLKTERGSHRARTRAFRVKPLVVIWGPASNAVPDGASFDGVDITHGFGLVDWFEGLDGDAIDEAGAADVLAHIERFRSSAWSAGAKR